MKKTIKTADLLAYLDSEIMAMEAASEKYARQLGAIDRGEWRGYFPADKVKERLNAHMLLMEHNIGALGKVKHEVYHMATKEDEKA